MDLWRQLGACLTKRSPDAGEEVVLEAEVPSSRGGGIGFPFLPHLFTPQHTYMTQSVNETCRDVINSRVTSGWSEFLY
jgi:hypothetical protein